ncbi:hypothetical protein CHLRE_03g194950v5 [Chlamydomonas reinhardtii]|uniref:RNA polymerase sigma factor n=2 Tax=Chlamydomonas reinhardtii TaxID=3055 RepID=Q8LK21_CHLRE|nr:uncharacterized protein CHLRE_03g194950v5 [Chlamydomonas reinhardtii]AAM88387.2 RNA polymerase sigma factor [Chlamydomonas reinhardtii]PNW85616.1 hypothetical protein CHLRE_03g194950v5 [Chlamydomonas reinhardtii]CAF25319.1 sigma-like transcription factor [Chlamydomonas reinhardtii]|eukprot:XP_001693275.1 chloroplast RNA polymerase sigma factor, c [Chlamydomonas reinhardtii]
MALPGSTMNLTTRCSTTPRSAVVARAVAAPTRPTTKSAVPELLDSRPGERNLNFMEYAQATQMLDRLKGQASDLELLLDQLNALEASLDESVLAPPTVDDPKERAARQARRAAKRAERRAQATSATVAAAAGPAMSAVVSHSTPTKAAAAPATSTASSSSSDSGLLDLVSFVGGFDTRPIPATTSAPPAGASSSDVQHLEDLFKLSVGEPDIPRASASAAPAVLRPRKLTPKKPSAAPSAAVTAAPSPAPTLPSTPSTSARIAPAPGSLADELERLLGPTTSREAAESEDEDSFAGPSEDDLLALEQEVSRKSSRLPVLDEEDEEDEQQQLEDNEEDAVAGPGSLEASAMATRTSSQLSIMQTGPSLLSLVPASAAPGRSAKARASRRAARNGHASGRLGGATANAAGRGKVGSKDGTMNFLGKVESLSTLDVEKEREVTAVCRDFLFLEKVKRQCEKTLHRPATSEEIAAAVAMDVESLKLRYDAGLKAKELLLKSNYKLVMTVCKSFVGKGPHIQDLVSEGVKGLLKGVEKYDATKGFRFGTYAHWWIRQAVSRSLAETGRAVRLPMHMIEQLTRLKNLSAKLQTQLAREPTLPELAKAAGLPVTRVQMLMETARSAASLDTPIGGNELGPTVKDSVEDEREAADEEFGSDSLRNDMEAMLLELPEREARVVRLRFGLDDGKEWTLEEIGEALNVTRERIRQIEAKALRKLRVKTIDVSGKLMEYGENLEMLMDGSREMAARTSSGTRKT